MVAYVSGIWQCRYFWFNLVKNDLRTRYRRSVLGLGWSLLHPIAMTIILCVAFQNIIRVGNVFEYAPFLLAGLATWTFFVTATLQGCQCFFLGESYIRQYPAPMAIYPLRTALGAMIHFFIALGVVLIAVALFRGFDLPGLLALFWLVPVVVLLFFFSWALAVLAGLATVYFQDTQHLCEVSFQGLIYLTPVLYPEKLLRDQGLGLLVDYNPLAVLIQLVRLPILKGEAPPVELFLVAIWAVVLLGAAAAVLLARYQRRIIFHL